MSRGRSVQDEMGGAEQDQDNAAGGANNAQVHQAEPVAGYNALPDGQ